MENKQTGENQATEDIDDLFRTVDQDVAELAKSFEVDRVTKSVEQVWHERS